MFVFPWLKLAEFHLGHPVALNEVKRLPPVRHRNWVKAAAVIGGVEFLLTLPGCWVPFVHWLWRLPTILVSATVISREVEDRTWTPVLSTPLTLRDIVMAKYAAIFHYMEPVTTTITYIRAVPLVVIGATWLASTLTVLPRAGLGYWAETTLAVLAAGIYFMLAPFLDVAVDGAIGLLASAISPHRSTAVAMAVLARATGWLLPLALAAPLQYGQYGAFGGLFSGLQPDLATLRALAIVATFGPAYAFPWGIPAWTSIVMVVVGVVLRLALVRLLLELTIIRAARIEV